MVPALAGARRRLTVRESFTEIASDVVPTWSPIPVSASLTVHRVPVLNICAPILVRLVDPAAYIAQYAAMPAPPALRATPLLLSAIVAAKAREIADAINREATKAAGPWPSPAETNPDAFGQGGGLPQGSSTSPWQWLQNAQSSALAQPQDFDEEGMRVLVAEEEEEMRLRCPPPSPER